MHMEKMKHEEEKRKYMEHLEKQRKEKEEMKLREVKSIDKTRLTSFRISTEYKN